MKTNYLYRGTAVIFIILAIPAILYFGRPFLIPLAFGALLAMLFEPLAQKLESWGLPRWSTITISILILVLLGGALTGAIIYQSQSLIQDWPQVKQQVISKKDQLENYAIKNLGILTEERVEQIKDRLAEQASDFGSNLRSFIGTFFSFTSQTFLVLVYVVFIMIIRDRFRAFILRLVPAAKEKAAREAMESAGTVVTQYLAGRLILMGILGVVYSAGFLAFGLEYAIPLAILAAVLTIVPYIGPLIGGIIVLLMALVTGGGTTVLFGVFGTMLVAQILESNVLEPWIIGSKVSLNAFTTFAAIIGFSLIWGVAGTILAIPIIGIAKEVFDKTESLKPFGFVMGLEKVEEE